MADPTTPEALIEAILLARLAEAAVAFGLPVAWPGQVFPPLSPTGEPTEMPPSFLRVQHDAIAVDRPFLTRTSRQSGSLMLSLSVPLGTSTVEARDDAAIVASYFPADWEGVLGGVSIRILDAPTVMGGYRDDVDSRWRTPVQIRYEAWIQAA